METIYAKFIVNNVRAVVEVDLRYVLTWLELLQYLDN